MNDRILEGNIIQIAEMKSLGNIFTDNSLSIKCLSAKIQQLLFLVSRLRPCDEIVCKTCLKVLLCKTFPFMFLVLVVFGVT